MTRSAVLVTTATLALLACLSGCSSGSSSHATPSASASPTATPSAAALSRPPFAPTYADLVGALPAAGDLPGWRIGTRCIRPQASCAHAPGRDPGHGTFQSAQGAERGRLREQLLTSVIRWPSASSARRFSQARCSRAEDDYTGTFDRGLRDRGDDTYQPGEEGIGTLAETSRGAWRGCRVSARLRYHLDDETSPLSEHTSYLLIRDRYGVLVQVDRWADRTGTRRSGATARRVVEALLARLDAG